jgi:hypothetical protein
MAGCAEVQGTCAHRVPRAMLSLLTAAAMRRAKTRMQGGAVPCPGDAGCTGGPSTLTHRLIATAAAVVMRRTPFVAQPRHPVAASFVPSPSPRPFSRGWKFCGGDFYGCASTTVPQPQRCPCPLFVRLSSNVGLPPGGRGVGARRRRIRLLRTAAASDVPHLATPREHATQQLAKGASAPLTGVRSKTASPQHVDGTRAIPRQGEHVTQGTHCAGGRAVQRAWRTCRTQLPARGGTPWQRRPC